VVVRRPGPREESILIFAELEGNQTSIAPSADEEIRFLATLAERNLDWGIIAQQGTTGECQLYTDLVDVIVEYQGRSEETLKTLLYTHGMLGMASATQLRSLLATETVFDLISSSLLEINPGDGEELIHLSASAGSPSNVLQVLALFGRAALEAKLAVAQVSTLAGLQSSVAMITRVSNARAATASRGSTGATGGHHGGNEVTALKAVLSELVPYEEHAPTANSIKEAREHLQSATPSEITYKILTTIATSPGLKGMVADMVASQQEGQPNTITAGNMTIIMKLLCGKFEELGDVAGAIAALAGTTVQEIEEGRLDMIFPTLRAISRVASVLRLKITADNKTIFESFMTISEIIGPGTRETAVVTFLIGAAFVQEAAQASKRSLTVGSGSLLSLKVWRDGKAGLYISEASCGRKHPFLVEQLAEMRRKEPKARTKPAADVADNDKKSKNTVGCFEFKKGSCSWGDRCKFSHAADAKCPNGSSCTTLAKGTCVFAAAEH